MTAQVAPPTAQHEVSYPAAELDRRFYAFVIDRLICWSIFGGAAFLAATALLADDSIVAGIALIAGVVVVVSLAYAALLGAAGTSPGKLAVGLRVVRVADGRPIGFGRALLRTVVLGVATLPTLGLGTATLAWTALADPSGKRRGAHDLWGRSIVIDVRPVPQAEVEDDDRPRQIVNLTAMRLLPDPAPTPIAPESLPTPRRAQPRPLTPPPAQVDGPPPSAPPTQQVGSGPSGPPPAAPPRRAAPRHARPQPEAPARDDALSRPTIPPVSSPAAPSKPVPAEPSVRWRVAFDTGESFVVEGLALVGRRPEARQGEPVKHLVPLRSEDMSVSKTHAQFQVVPDGALVVMDRGSTNGSSIKRGGLSKSLTPGRPATLLDGDVVKFGDRTMTVTKLS